MSVLNRVSKLMTANINHLLDQAEDPEVMIKQLVRDMEASIVELRRETVSAVAREKRLVKKIHAADELARELEKKAGLALDKGNEELARDILAKKLQTTRSGEALTEELRGARDLAERLKADLVRMEDQAGLARRKQEELIRRKRAAEAQLRTQDAARRSAEAVGAASDRLSGLNQSASAFDAYSESILTIEAEAEATRELSTTGDDKELELEKITAEAEVDDELERLKQERAAK
jgi:phage shock protein A